MMIMRAVVVCFVVLLVGCEDPAMRACCTCLAENNAVCEVMFPERVEIRFTAKTTEDIANVCVSRLNDGELVGTPIGCSQVPLCEDECSDFPIEQFDTSVAE